MSAATRTLLPAALGGLLLLGVGSAVLTRLPQPDDITDAPFVVTARMTEPGRLRTGTVTVTSVEAGPELAGLEGVATSTSGTFVVVRLVWEPSGAPRGLTRFSLRATDGRVFDTNIPIRPTCPDAQTGIPVRCAAAFEVPKDALQGATLLVPADPSGSTEGDQELRVDLGLDAAAAARLAANTGQIKMGSAEQGVGR